MSGVSCQPDPIAGIFGMSRAAFLAEHYAQKPLLSPNPVVAELLSRLPTPESFVETLALLSERADLVQIALDSRAQQAPQFADGRLDLQATWSRYYDGCSVILNNLYKVDRGTKAICDLLAVTLGHQVQANAYFTPPHAAAFPTHYDTHDVIVVQLAGAKQWIIHEFSPEVPVCPAPGAAPLVPPERLESAVHQDLTLSAGHALYVPRGRPHRVFTSDEASFHITFGLKPVGLAQLLRIAIDMVEAAEPEMRRHLGPDMLLGTDWALDPAPGIERLLGKLAAPELQQRALQALRKQVLRDASLSPAALFASDPAARQAIRWKQPCYADLRIEADGQAVLTNGIKAIRLAPAEVALVKTLRGGETLVLADDGQFTALASRLVALGLAEPVTEADVQAS